MKTLFNRLVFSNQIISNYFNILNHNFTRTFIKSLIYDLSQVHTIDAFQGQESNVVILSLVRSSKVSKSDKDNSKKDDKNPSSVVKAKLGFVSCRRRLNVAVTRARSLLIVIGNADVLSLDKHWASFIAYCNKKGCFYDTTEIRFRCFIF